jgi:hypothetical protein
LQIKNSFFEQDDDGCIETKVSIEDDATKKSNKNQKLKQKK